jgi:hypothetical protein
MAGFSSVSALAQAYDAGRTHFCSFRKVPSQASVALNWVDLSMAAGNPLPNYYAASPLVADTLDGMKGMFHGADKSPASMHLTDFGIMTPTANCVGRVTLMDYLLYYPFVDGDSADEQPMDNAVSLPRYANGVGVQVMAVAVAPTAGGGTFTFNYRDHNGDLQTSPLVYCNTTACGIATIATSEQAQNAGGRPFLPLASGSQGVRSIESVTFLSPSGGLLSLVMVMPLWSTAIREINTMQETNFVSTRPGCPRIYDGAYLNMIANPAGSVAAGIFTGYAKFAWSA